MRFTALPERKVKNAFAVGTIQRRFFPDHLRHIVADQVPQIGNPPNVTSRYAGTRSQTYTHVLASHGTD